MTKEKKTLAGWLDDPRGQKIAKEWLEKIEKELAAKESVFKRFLKAKGGVNRNEESYFD